MHNNTIRHEISLSLNKSYSSYGIIVTLVFIVFFNNFGKTVNLNFNWLPGVNSLCSIYFIKDAKKKFHQIYLKTVKLPYLTENGILNNFDPHG